MHLYLTSFTPQVLSKLAKFQGQKPLRKQSPRLEEQI